MATVKKKTLDEILEEISASTPIYSTTISVSPTDYSTVMTTGTGIKTTMNHIFPFDTDMLHDLFSLPKWEETQLYGILDELGMLRNENGFVAGGSLVRHFLGTDITRGDIDIYPRQKNGLVNLMTHFDKKGIKLVKTKFSYTGEYKKGARKIKIQVINSSTKYMNDVLTHFDFEHVRIAYDGRFHATLGAPVAIAQKVLHPRFIRDPAYSLIRAMKYKKLGFDSDAAISKLAYMASKGLKDINAKDTPEAVVEY